ncbi:GATA transcription factor 9-like [Olea europaea var. sylvestris]|uniref:GATA transcription factor n=1 Tax=Olea europaea subsp. europaea TaxID=158383 RepID=A0A8S0VFP0_OLEEU|nr:GATA transcription factor 9-like [Olea europaea var. sylvestris]CAA3030648.1 GATA transcription factor 12-like [Olea europaea subsp. europaea]
MMEYFMGDYAEFSSVDNINGNSNGNGAHFTVDDLLDFSKEDVAMTDAFFDSLAANSGDSSAVTVVDSCNSSVSGGGDGQFNGKVSCRSFTDSQFSGNELCVPYDDLAELEWLSNFVEESFSSDDVHKLHFIPTHTATAVEPTVTSSSATTISVSPINHSPPPPIFPSDVSVPGKARSKRSRAAPCDWSSRLLLLSAPPSSTSYTHYNNITANTDPNPKAMKTTPTKRREPTETPGRKCLHCASEKTPQWRTGPLGPKTLCNACGVRYKSGRLVPEYRPAASPTFVSTKHSNSHRKVVELRRQKELQMHQQQLLSQTSIFNISNGCDDFLIHHHNGANDPDFKNVI